MNITSFHEPPVGYSYRVEKFKKDVYRIDLVYKGEFVYNDGAESKTVWGFYNLKTDEFHSPVNYKKMGKKVKLRDTTPFSAMKINKNNTMIENLTHD